MDAAARQRLQEAAQADPEIGGARLRPVIGRVNDLIARHTTGAERRELHELLDETGLGDHPVLLRFLGRVAETVQRHEDMVIRTTARMTAPPVVVPAAAVDPVVVALQAATAAMHRRMADAFWFGDEAGPVMPDAYAADDDGRSAAAARGLDLLKSWLTDEQRAQFERERCFEVIGGTTGRRYRIRDAGPFNIDELDQDGRTADELCVEPRGGLCRGDKLLAQKIALEHDEENALRVANRGRADGSALVILPGCVSYAGARLPLPTWRHIPMSVVESATEERFIADSSSWMGR
jgi:hypothetical protein